MRPLRLDLAGFTVFRDETTVDFTDADFFALVGPTGAGKSTVLDAICFALYGTVPRWGNRNAIANALAPSATEARVRLVFESAGARYVATRVVRRDGKGKVTTASAGLEQLPAGFDVRRFDTGLTPDDLGEVRAGTPTEMDAAVREAVGLPYEQFTSCVVLPQGEFAEFLHAKPATRQQILVNLLGLHVYERIRERAASRAAAADAHLAAVDRILGGLADVDDDARAAAEARTAAVRELAAAVESAVPGLEEAQRKAAAEAAALADLDAEIARLGAVRAPADVADVAGAVAAARAAAGEAAEAVTAAEEREEKLRGELAAAGDAAALQLLVRAHAERTQLSAEDGALGAAVAEAQSAHTEAVAALAGARDEATRAREGLEAARVAYQDAQTADRAAALRAHLTVGAACPVCEQPVAALPKATRGSAVSRSSERSESGSSRLAAAEAAGKAARAAADAADKLVAERDRAARELERTLDRARAHHEQIRARLSELDTRLAGAPDPPALKRALDALAALQRELDTATAAVRTAREAQRRAQAGAGAADERLRRAWRGFDTTRDAVAALGPPAADRDDLAAAWFALAGWASGAAADRGAAREAVVASVAEARSAADSVRRELAGLFDGAGMPAPADDAFGRAAAVAVERAEAEERRLAERRAQAEELRAQRADHERDSRVAKALAGHLRANNFERWLLEEALDLLVDGASRILRELSGGQYDLVHTKGEFFVVDHHDAGLRRPVRTLSGGETFQASLALALALSEQLAGLSSAAASLESIILDEGFGTLDASTLDTVAATLESLAARGDRMVGVVTHVPSLAERVPVRFEVTKDARTARIERIGLL
jgi:DNA repair protein SbcC/Rad50